MIRGERLFFPHEGVLRVVIYDVIWTATSHQAHKLFCVSEAYSSQDWKQRRQITQANWIVCLITMGKSPCDGLSAFRCIGAIFLVTITST